MTILIDNTIDTVRSTINGIDIVSSLINAYNEANGAFARANTIDGISSLTVTATGGVAVGGGSTSTLSANGTFVLTANAGTTGAVGVVQLTDSQSSTSTTTAATPNSVKLTNDAAQAAFLEANSFQSVINSAFALANTLSGSSGIQTLRFFAGQGLTVNTGSAVTVTTASNTVIFSTNTASTTQVGVVQLNDTETSTSTTLAATANSVGITWNAASAAYLQANAATNSATSAFGNSNAAYTQANAATNSATSAYGQANAATNSAQAAYNAANTAVPANNVINFGGKANTRGIQARVAYANGNFANIGDAQWAVTLLRNQTTGAAATYNLSTSGANTTTNLYGSINQLELGNNCLYAFNATVAARDTTNMACKIWEVKGGIKNIVGPSGTTPIANTSVMGTPVINIIAADNGTNNWTVGVAVDLANTSLLFTATGATNQTNWVASVTTTEVA